METNKIFEICNLVLKTSEVSGSGIVMEGKVDEQCFPFLLQKMVGVLI